MRADLMVMRGHVSVTWRDVALLSQYIEARCYPVLPGTTRYSGIAGRAISEQSPGSPSISGHYIDVYSSGRIYLCYI
eukprot:97658-Amorphochlora_amoeboformis.AAC.1